MYFTAWCLMIFMHDKTLENIVAFFGLKNYLLCIGQAWNSTEKG